MSDEPKKPLRERLESAFEIAAGVATGIVYAGGRASPAKGFKEGCKGARALMNKLKGKPEEPDETPPEKTPKADTAPKP